MREESAGQAIASSHSGPPTLRLSHSPTPVFPRRPRRQGGPRRGDARQPHRQADDCGGRQARRLAGCAAPDDPPRRNQRRHAHRTGLVPLQGIRQVAHEGLRTARFQRGPLAPWKGALLADTTPDPGTLRFETRNDDEFYYPDFGIDLALPEDRFTQVAVYLLPWDVPEHGVGVEIWDAEKNRRLDRQHFSKLWDGTYAVYHLAGKVRIRRLAIAASRSQPAGEARKAKKDSHRFLTDSPSRRSRNQLGKATQTREAAGPQIHTDWHR